MSMFSLNHLLLLIVPGVVFGSTSSAADDADQLLQALRTADTVLERDFSLRIVVTEPCSWFHLDQGFVTREGLITLVGTMRGLILENSHFESLPQYKPSGSHRYRRSGYDPDGNLVVWRPGDSFLAQNDERNDTYAEWVSYAVGPDNRAVAADVPYKELSRWSPSDRNGLALYNMILLTTGRGFAQHLDGITAIETTDSSLVEVAAHGSYLATLSGAWVLTVDPGAEYIVRSAAFTVAGQSKPLYSFSTSGTLRHKTLTLPKEGVLTRAAGGDDRMRVTVKFVRIDDNGDPDAISRIMDRVAGELPKGAVIMDYRADPRNPVRTRVGDDR